MDISLYSIEQEENIHTRKQAATWQRSGLITDEQLATIIKRTDPDVRQTNIFFRAIFFIFTCLCVGAVLGLFVWSTGIGRHHMALAFTLIVASVIIYFMAEHAVTEYHFYRHGIEEALALSSMVLICWGIVGTITILSGRHSSHWHTILTCHLFAISAFWLYLRFGYLYAALISIISICIIPFQLSLPPLGERGFLLIILCLILFLTIIVDNSEIEDFKIDNNTTIQACLLIAIYMTVNLEIIGALGLLTGDTSNMHLYPKLFPPYIYWSSYIFTFIIPAAAIYWGINSRKRLILNASLVMACVTLATNKSYLGWTRYAWDPAILGTALVILFIIINNWLNTGENKSRDGFTAEDILKPENHGISLAEVAASLTPIVTALGAQQQPTQQDKFFEGGKSGGGGVSGDY